MSDIKLKPCPFCGGEAEFCRTSIKTSDGWSDGVFVYCTECRNRTSAVLYNKQEHGECGEYKEASEKWNTRKPMDRIVERLEAEKKYYDEADKTFIYSTNHINSRAFQKAINIVKAGGVDG